MIRPLDLRLRLVTVVMALLLIAPLRGPLSAGLALALVLALFAVAREVPAWHRLLHLEAFLVLLFLTLPFAVPGEELLRIGPFAATDAGLWLTLTLTCKVTASVLLLSLLLRAVEPVELGSALRELRAPEPLVRLLIGTIRAIALIRDEFQRRRETMRARAFRAASNRHTWRSYGYLIGMVAVRALERSERVEEAMRLRGYSGRFPSRAWAAPSVADWATSAAIVTAAAALLLMDRL